MSTFHSSSTSFFLSQLLSFFLNFILSSPSLVDFLDSLLDCFTQLAPFVPTFHTFTHALILHLLKWLMKEGGRNRFQSFCDRNGRFEGINSWESRNWLEIFSSEFSGKFGLKSVQIQEECNRDEEGMLVTEMKKGCLWQRWRDACDSGEFSRLGWSELNRQSLDPESLGFVFVYCFNHFLSHSFTHSLSHLPNPIGFVIKSIDQSRSHRY